MAIRILAYEAPSQRHPRKIRRRAFAFLGLSCLPPLGPLWDVLHDFRSYFWSDFPYVLIPVACMALALCGFTLAAFNLIRALEYQDRFASQLSIAALVMNMLSIVAIVLAPSIS